MSEGLGGSAKQQPNYGSTNDRVPNVAIAGTQVSPAELTDLSGRVTSNIYNINSNRKDLEQKLRMIGTPKDSQTARTEIYDKLVVTNELVETATKDLHQLTALVKKGNKHQKLNVDKLTNTFKEAVQMYQRVQKQVVKKLRTHMLPSENALLQETAQSSDFSNAEQADPNIQRSIANKLEFEKGLLLEREQTMQSIENCVIDINQIMQEIGVMVHQQGEDINSIENAIETVQGNVEAGQSELEKAAVSITRRRKKTCLLLGISVAAGIILAVILALSLK